MLESRLLAKLFSESLGLLEVNLNTSLAVASQGSDLFALLVQSIKDYAIFVLDPEGHVLTWNAGAKTIKGYSSEEIVGKHFSIFYPPEAVRSGWPSRELALAEKAGRFADEGWRVRKDGTLFWASVIITALRNPSGSLCGFAKITRDLTERRRIEERFQALNKELRCRVEQLDESQRLVELRTLELQKLSARLLHVQDEERRRVARDLHDDIGQRLSALKMAMDLDANPKALEIIDATVSAVRSLSYLLHPPLLDETGLLSALHWLVDGVAKRSGIQISLDMKPEIFPRLPQDTETAIFRIVQESLMNVYRHSFSETARVVATRLGCYPGSRLRQGTASPFSRSLGNTRFGCGHSRYARAAQAFRWRADHFSG